MADRILPSATGTRMPPGFRFRPTDEELISYYLKRKVQGKPMVFDAIGEVDVYNHDPSDLPERSKLNTGDQAWFFFTIPERHGGTRIKRARNKGCWNQKSLNKDIKRGEDNKLIGKVKRLVFQRGSPPNDQPTNWVIHEYRLADDDGHRLERDAYVLCRLSQNIGNINAPFSEQEWDDASVGEGRALVTSLVLANTTNEKIQQERDSGSKNLFDLNELPSEFEMDDNPKTVDQDYNNDPCLLPCVLTKEAPIPFTQYRRKRQIDSFGSHTTHQDHCSSPKSTSETTMLEECEPEPVDTITVVPTSSSTELIKDLQKQNKQMTVELDGYKLEINALRMEIEELKKNNSNKKHCS